MLKLYLAKASYSFSKSNLASHCFDLKLIIGPQLFLSMKNINNQFNYLPTISNNSTSKINKLFAGIVGLALDP